jgi:hypothetical protein
MLSIRRRRFHLFAVGLVAAVLAGCSVSSATLGDLVTAKDKEAKTKTTTFAPNDTIWLFAPGKFLPGKVSMKLKTFAEKVEGQPPHTALPNFEGAFDLPSDGSVSFNLTPPPTGWLNGQYLLEVTMVSSDDNIERGKKSVIVTVAGAANPPPAAPQGEEPAPAEEGQGGDNAGKEEPQH